MERDQHLTQCLFFLTNACNLRCAHCYASSGFSVKGELNQTEIKKCLQILKDNGIQSISLLGGEPTILPYFPEVLDFTIRLFPVPPVVQTNATVPFPFHKYDCTVVASIESIKPFEDELVRGRPELVTKYGSATPEEKIGLRKELVENSMHFFAAMEFLKTLDFERNTPFIRATCFEDNDVIGLAHFASQVGYNFLVAPYIQVGRGKAFPHLHPPSAQRLANVYSELTKIRRQNPDLVFYFDQPQWQFYDETEYKRNAYKFDFIPNPCVACTRRITVDSKGDVFPCHFLMDKKFVLGNLLENDFKKIKRNALEFVQELDKKLLRSDCATCQFVERCQGGCRLYAVFEEERGDPKCPLRPLGLSASKAEVKEELIDSGGLVD